MKRESFVYWLKEFTSAEIIPIVTHRFGLMECRFYSERAACSLAMRDAAPVFSSTLVLIALPYHAKKTLLIELLASGEAGRIEFRLVQSGPASWLTHANNH